MYITHLMMLTEERERERERNSLRWRQSRRKVLFRLEEI